MNAEEVNETYRNHDYNPYAYYENDPRLHEVLDQLTNGFFDKVNPNEFEIIRNNLLYNDNYFVLKDFDAYVKAHEKINALYQDQKKWLHMSIVNVAKSGYFTTDRTMEQYNADIWHTKSLVNKK